MAPCPPTSGIGCDHLPAAVLRGHAAMGFARALGDMPWRVQPFLGCFPGA